MYCIHGQLFTVFSFIYQKKKKKERKEIKFLTQNVNNKGLNKPRLDHRFISNRNNRKVRNLLISKKKRREEKRII